MIDFYKYKIIDLSDKKEDNEEENKDEKFTKKDIYACINYLQKRWRK
ncbi:hypothetical protein [Carnobacterium inhibens]|uniref:Uncharacterized protein n=2 Tax=Carnobacterium inhibens TaxID=147709 RepID=U5SGE4_9LACT|nr:hypothetical protein [Carnobacterium inhibens]AGY82967.1 hypothetical protein Q783_11695 [Carnobacterium inhibens subsp. gilichinskyi]MBC9826231.1 hypothetical protein [Carnobacterium inhibens]